MRFLIDNALSPALAELLRNAGYAAVHVRDLGLRSADDITRFERAAADDLVVVSADTAFGTLLASRDSAKPSVVLFRGEGSRAPADLFAIIQGNIRQLCDALEDGAIAVFEPSRLRVRRLPIVPRPAPGA